MNKKLLAAVIMSLAMAAPQVKAEPSALEQALNDPNTERFIMPSDQSISADLPIGSERYFEINDYESPTSEHYFNIIGNGHSGFGDTNNGAFDVNNVNTISGFNTKASASNPNGDGGAFFLDNDACLTVVSSIYDANKKPLMTTIAGNTAAGKGGAIYANYNWGGAVYLANTNIKDNVAGDKGGGLYLDWGISKIVALPGTNVVIADNTAVIDGQSVDNDIYLHSGRTQQGSGGLRGTLDLMTRSTASDPSSSVPTGESRIYVGDLRADGSSDVEIMSSTKDTATGNVMIENLMLDNDAMLSTKYVAPNSKTSIYIPELTMSRDSIINTVNGYIDDNLHIIDISLDNSNNKFMVDASLMNGNTVIDHFGTISGGTGKLLVNIIGSDTTSGSVRLSTVTTSTATFAESTTQYGGLKYTFTQDENDKGIFHYTTTKDRSVSLQDALKDWTLTEYDMPDLTVADSDLGNMWHYDDEGYFVERTLTINGNNGILITDGQERAGISIPHQLYPPEEDFLTPKLIVNDLELVSGFTKSATNLHSFGTGGAIDAEDAVLELHNVTFSDNIAKGAGTAVDINTFGMGGAVYLTTRDGYERVVDPNTGGYIQGDHFKSIIEDSTFLNNKAISTKGSAGSFNGIVDGGGAVFAKGDLDITDSLFASNSAISAISEGVAEAGALYLTNNSEYAGINCNVNIADTMFMSNIAGDVENEGDALLNTSAYGGALMSSRVDLNITNSQFVDNLAQAAQLTNEYTTVKGEAQGGAIHIERMLPGSNAINIDGTTFAMNETKVVDSETLSTDGVSQAKSMGGAIAIMPSSAINKMDVHITNSDFVANKSGKGGAIYNAGSNVVIKDSTFNSNTANHYLVDSSPRWNEDMEGGAIYNASFAKLSLDGVTFTGNLAKEITYDGETPIVSTVKNDIRNDASSTGGLYFIGDASELDGGIIGNGYTHFNLGLDEFGNVDPDSTNTEMTIGANTSIIQSVIDVNSGTVNVVNGNNLTARSALTIGENGTLNIASGNVNITNKYVREIENNGVLTLASDYLTDTHSEEGLKDLTITNNGAIIASIDNKGIIKNYENGYIDTTSSDVNSIINNADKTIINAGEIDTALLTNSGTLINGVNPDNPEELITTAVINGDVLNTATAYNAGVITGDVDNSGGSFQNDGLILGFTQNYDEGEFTNDAIIGGDVYNAVDSTFTNNSAIAGGLDNYGTFINAAGAELDSTILEGTANSVINRGGATLINNGSIVTATITNSGDFTNNATIEGNVNNTMGDFTNSGSVTGNVTNMAGSFANVGFITGNFTNNFSGDAINGGIINGNVTNNLGDFTNAGIITGDVANDDDFTNYGAIAGDLENEGDFLNNGTIDGDVDNSGKLTSNLEDIGGTINMSWSTAELELLNNGITFDDTNKSKIQGNKGTLSLYGDILSNAVLDYTGKIELNGGARIVKGENGDAFQNANGIYISNPVTATISALNGTADALNYNKIDTAVGSTLRLEMDWNDTLTADGSLVAGDVEISKLDLRDVADGDKVSIINDSIGSKVVIRDIDLITNKGNANSVTYTYHNATVTTPGYGELTAVRIPSLATVINTSATNDDEDAYYNYSMDSNEQGSTTNIIGHLKVNGAGNAIETTGLVIGDATGTETGDVILRDTNISNVNTTGNGALSVNIGSHLTIRADEYDVNISGTSGANKNAIHLAGTLGDALATVSLEANNGHTMTINDDIVSTNRNNRIFFNNGKINMNGVIDPITAVNTGADVTRGGQDADIQWRLYGGTLTYLSDSYLNNTTNLNSIEFAGGNLDLRNGAATTIALNNLTVSNDSNIYVDVDLANSAMDKFNATTTTYTGGTLNVAGMTLLSDAKTDKTTINFTSDATLMGNVDYTGSTALSRIFKYNVGYDNTTGDFDFTRMATGSYKDYNPGVLAAPIAAQLGGYLTQLNSYDQAFMNMDTYMMMPKNVRTALKMRNKIASLENAQYDDTKSMYDYTGAWVRPYATFENVHLHNGPRVSNVMYGSFFGGESPLYDLGHGWDGMWGAYVGYNGSHQAYDGVGIYQNGGTLGLTGMAYKGNYFVGGTVNVGAAGAEASTAFGSDDFAMLMTGAALKTGYNWELANGKFIIQPNLMASYSFVNTFNSRSSSGVAIESDPLHAITIEPGVKFIGNLKNGWQPYAGVSVVFNIMDRTRFQANDVSLPNFSINPFVRYGVGVRKTWGERLTGHFQTYMTNGGRNGVGLSAGLRWAIGKDGSNDVKGKTPELKPTKISLNNHK